MRVSAAARRGHAAVALPLMRSDFYPKSVAKYNNQKYVIGRMCFFGRANADHQLFCLRILFPIFLLFF